MSIIRNLFNNTTNAVKSVANKAVEVVKAVANKTISVSKAVGSKTVAQARNAVAFVASKLAFVANLVTRKVRRPQAARPTKAAAAAAA